MVASSVIFVNSFVCHPLWKTYLQLHVFTNISELLIYSANCDLNFVEITIKAEVTDQPLAAFIWWKLSLLSTYETRSSCCKYNEDCD